MQQVTRTLIAQEEYDNRLARLREHLVRDGYDAALVWGRGGGTVDRYSDTLYLTGYYPSFPTIRDVPGVWSDRGLSALLVTDTEAVLFCDEPGAEDVAFGLTSAVVRHGVYGQTLAHDVLEALGDRSGIERLVLVAGDAMSGLHANDLLTSETFERLSVDWQTTYVETLRRIKSEPEIQLMRHAASIARAALETGFAQVSPGVRECDIISAMGAEVLQREAALANAFVYTTPRHGVPEEHRLPTFGGRALEEGDLFTIDLTGAYAGYFFDLARSTVVGGRPTQAQDRSYRLARDVVNAVVERMQPGTILGEAAAVGSAMLRAAGLDPDDAEFAARGHGLGLGFESPWVRDETMDILEPGMVISIEQFVTLDGMSATFERNILMTSDGPEDLAEVPDFWPES